MSWPAKRWMISSTSFRMRLTTARKLLNDLSGIRLDGDHNAVCWTLELNDVRLEDERQRVMIEAYQEKPANIDSGILDVTDRAVDVRAAIVDAYRIMKACVYSKDSPLRTESGVWDAFEEQKDEFIGFYKSALNALE